MSDSTPCYIYRSKKQLEMYLFLAKEDDFECVPDEILKGLGQLEKAMELELTPESKLARSNPEEVIRNLKERGFHIQMPPPNPVI
jgi:uncharacterized protein YcgL (UPF0745 family)